jgi:hypothetical protein
MVFDADDIKIDVEQSIIMISLQNFFFREKVTSCKSRLISRLRFFFLFDRKCHWWWQNWSISFLSCVKFSIPVCKVCLRLHQEFVSLPNIIFFCFFSVIRSSSFNQKAKENPLFLWRWLSSGTSNAATAEFSSCFYILDEVSKMNFVVFWNGNGTVDPFLTSISGEEKERIGLLFSFTKTKEEKYCETHRNGNATKFL